MWMCFLVKFYIPLFWKIGNIWRVKNSTEMWSLVALNVLYLTFFFISSFLTTWHFHSLMRLFRVPRAGFKGCTLAILLLEDHWSDESGLTAAWTVYTRNRSASVLLCRSPCPPESKLRQRGMSKPIVWVCVQFPQLAGNCGVLFCFCFQCKCDVIFLFSLDQSWTEIVLCNYFCS